MSFTTEWKPEEDTSYACYKCGTVGQVEYRIWESSCGGYDDYKFRCNHCQETWWVEGPDA